MGWAAIGINNLDFENNALVDMGTGVTHVPVTETEDFRGNKTFVFSGTSTITAVFHIRENRFVRDKEGTRQLAPAYLMHKVSDSVERGDKIIIGTGTASNWKVFNVENRPKEEPQFRFSDLYLWD